MPAPDHPTDAPVDAAAGSEIPELPSLTPVSTLEPVDLVAADGGVPLAGRQARQGRLGVFGLLAVGWLVLVTLLAVLAPVLPLDDPDDNIASIVGQGPGTDGHLLGGDDLGRDLLSRMIWGARASLLLGASSVVIGLVAGGVLGLIAGYFRGGADTVLSGMFDILLSFPQLILAVTLVTVFASGEGTSATRRMVVLILALGLVSIPVLARITRANTMAWSQREFVMAARAHGGEEPPDHVRGGAAQRAAGDVLDRAAGHGGGDRGRGRPQPARCGRPAADAVLGQHPRPRAGPTSATHPTSC